MPNHNLTTYYHLAANPFGAFGDYSEITNLTNKPSRRPGFPGDHSGEKQETCPRQASSHNRVDDGGRPPGNQSKLTIHRGHISMSGGCALLVAGGSTSSLPAAVAIGCTLAVPVHHQLPLVISLALFQRPFSAQDQKSVPVISGGPRHFFSGCGPLSMRHSQIAGFISTHAWYRTRLH